MSGHDQKQPLKPRSALLRGDWLKIEFLVIPLFILAAATLFWVDSVRTQTLIQRILHEEQEIFHRDVDLLAGHYDRLLRELSALEHQLSERKEHQLSALTAVDEARVIEAIAPGMEALMVANPYQMQFRWIDEQGIERLRYDRRGDQVIRLPLSQLQDKAHRGYTQKALALAPGQFYISAINLNIEQGTIERPYKPTFRVALRISEGLGFLIINQNAQAIFDALQSEDEAVSTWLINSQGDWLKGPDPEMNWGFQLGKRHRISDYFSSEVSDSILSQTDTQQLTDDRAIYLSYKLPIAQGSPRDVQIEDHPILVRFLHPEYFERSNAQSRFAPLTLLILILACFTLFLFLRQWRRASKAQSDRQAREEEMSRLHGIANLLPQLTWTCTPGGVCDFISQSWGDFTGTSPSELVGAGWVDFVHPDDHEELFRCWNHSIATGEDFFVRFRIRSHSGEYRMFDTRARALKDSYGRVLQWFGSNTDIEDTISYEKRLERERERLKTELQISDQQKQKATERLELTTLASQVGIWEYNLDSQTLIWDYRMFELYGVPYTAEPMPLDVWSSHLVPEDLTEVEALMGEALQSGNSFACEFRIVRPDQTHIWVKADAFIVRDESGAPLRMVGGNRDITKSKQLMAELKDANEHLSTALEQAEAATQAKSHFLANMSHEIRTPMNGIVGMLALLNNDSTLSPQQKEYCQLAYQSSEHLTDVLNDILDLSRIESGRITPVNQEFSLELLLQEAVEVFSLSAKQKQVELSTDFADTPEFLVGDPLRISQIISNIVGNAVKFTPEGGWIQVNVAVRPLDSAEQRNLAGSDLDADVLLQVSVTDTGIGISAEQQKEIFKPFTQADETTTRRFGGTGLGLAICHQLTELLGGSLTVESHLGQGAEFTLSLPLGRSALSESVDGENLTTPIIKSGSDTSPVFDLSGLSVLTVDDQPMNNRVVEGLMRHAGVEVEVACSAAEAIDHLQRKPFDLVLMDVHMEVMSGLEATEEIRRLTGIHQPLIFGLSASVMKEDQQRGLDSGMDAYLMKPFKLEALFQALERFKDRLPQLKEEQAGGVNNVVVNTLPLDDTDRLAALPECIDPRDFTERLRSDYPLLMQSIQAFVQSFSDMNIDIKTGASDLSKEQAVQYSHKVKGGARSIGDTALAMVAADAEQKARAADAVTDVVIKALQATQELLDKHLIQLGSAVLEWQSHQVAEGLSDTAFKERRDKLLELADSHRFIPADYWKPFIDTLELQGSADAAAALADAFVAFDNDRIVELLEQLQDR